MSEQPLPQRGLVDLEELLGGVAGPSIGRLALRGDAFNTGFGYGVYFTDSRIIGISYARMLSRSYYPAYLVELAFFILLTLAIVFTRLAGIPADQPLPLVFGPVLALLPLTFILFYLKPKQAVKRIMTEAPRTLTDIVNQSPDVVIERGEIAQVTVDGYRINILTKPGQWYTFIVKVAPRLYPKPLSWKGQPAQLIDMLQKFCSQSPPIAVYVKQKGQWNSLLQTGVSR